MKKTNDLLSNWEEDEIAFPINQNEFIILTNILSIASNVFAASCRDCVTTKDLKRADYFDTLSKQTEYMLSLFHEIAKSGYDSKAKNLH